MSESNHTLSSKNQSDITGNLEITREEVRAIQKLCEKEMREDQDEGHIFELGGSNWADLSDLRIRCKHWLVKNQ